MISSRLCRTPDRQGSRFERYYSTQLLVQLLALESNKSSPKKVLCVEDDRDTCDVLRFIMTEYEFTAVHSMEEAQALIAQQTFDLYVLDNWLPDGSGIELCKKIRESGIVSPIVFTSAIGQRHDIELAMNAGADRYLVKPYEPDALLRTVKELINPNGELAYKS